MRGLAIFEVLLVLAVCCLVVLLCASTGVEKSQPVEGIVVKKEHQPARIYTITSMIPVLNGKTTSLIPVVITNFDDEDWILHIKSDDKNRGIVSVYVSEKVYGVFQVGDRIESNKVQCTMEDKDKEIKCEEQES